MIPDLDITIDLGPLMEQIDRNDRDAAIAAAEAIGDLAQAGKAVMIQAMGDGRFTLRRDWIQKGWRSSPLHVDRYELMARIFHLDRQMFLQEYGGTKRPVSGSHISIPGKALRPEGASASRRKVREKDWPSNAFGRKGVFSSLSVTPQRYRRRLKSGALAILERVKGKRNSKRLYRAAGPKKKGVAPPLARRQVLARKAKVLHVLSRSSSLKARLGLRPHIQSVCEELWAHFFGLRYAERIRRARYG